MYVCESVCINDLELWKVGIVQVSRYNIRYFIGFCVCFDVLLVFARVFYCFYGLGEFLGRAWGRLGYH